MIPIICTTGSIIDHDEMGFPLFIAISIQTLKSIVMHSLIINNPTAPKYPSKTPSTHTSPSDHPTPEPSAPYQTAPTPLPADDL